MGTWGDTRHSGIAHVGGWAKAKVISKGNEERDSERELLFHKEARRKSELSR